MSSIIIHQDILNFEKKYAGFSARQIIAIAISALLAIAFVFIGWFLLALPYRLIICVWAVFGLPVLASGIVPVLGMYLEEFLARCLSHAIRGSYIHLDDKSALGQSQLTKSYKKQIRKGQVECMGTTGKECIG